MVWFKVDDTFAFHQKCVAAGNAAVGLWVRAGSWCAAQLNDGFVPDHMIASLGTKGQAARLVSVRLWHREDGGFRFHQWNEDGRQPSREEVEAKRQEWRDKKRRQRRDKDTGQYAVSPEVSPRDSLGDSPEESHRPVPSRPVPTTTTYVEGGSHVSSGPRTAPPRFPDHCDEHADTAKPGNCGHCREQREANKARAEALPDYRLRVVPPLCGECDERWIETPDGLAKCPRCYPTEARTA